MTYGAHVHQGLRVQPQAYGLVHCVHRARRAGGALLGCSDARVQIRPSLQDPLPTGGGGTSAGYQEEAPGSKRMGHLVCLPASGQPVLCCGPCGSCCRGGGCHGGGTPAGLVVGHGAFCEGPGARGRGMEGARARGGGKGEGPQATYAGETLVQCKVLVVQ